MFLTHNRFVYVFVQAAVAGGARLAPHYTTDVPAKLLAMGRGLVTSALKPNLRRKSNDI